MEMTKCMHTVITHQGFLLVSIFLAIFLMIEGSSVTLLTLSLNRADVKRLMLKLLVIEAELFLQYSI